jgi:hypothetical protein
MDAGLIIAIVVIAALVVLAIAGWSYMQRNKRSEQLRERFGPEYDRTVSSAGKRGEAERELQERQQRVERLRIKELTPEERERYSDAWHRTQAHFVDDPSAAIGEADELVQKVMDARGYPISNFEQQAADISVDHPEVVRNYRAAHAIVIEHKDKGVTTEDLRQAMVHYRALFADLLGASPVRS